MLNYHHLRYFHAVAREGNLTRASHALDKTPQTVSHQIKALEKSLGTTLFERRGRRLTLTPEGALEPVDDPRLLAGIPVPPSVLNYGR